jgi:hypothetical protein
MPIVYLLTTGDGSDGDAWDVLGIYSSREKAEQAQVFYQRERPRGDGSSYRYFAAVEKWEVDEHLEP